MNSVFVEVKAAGLRAVVKLFREAAETNDHGIHDRKDYARGAERGTEEIP